MERNHIIELRRHDELIRFGDQYATLIELQARDYR